MNNMLAAVLIFLIIAGDANGSYIVEVTVHSYSNPTGRCDECQPGSQPGCCDETFVRPADQTCPNNSTCDTLIQYCYETSDGSECDTFTYYSKDQNSIDIENSLHSFDNPITVKGNEPWNGIQIVLASYDCSIDENQLCGPNKRIDAVLIDIDIPVGTSDQTRTYRGRAGIAQFRVSFTVKCAPGYNGDQCTKSEGVVPVGAIVGGAVGGVFFILIILCCACCVCFMCLPKTKSGANEVANAAPPPRTAEVILEQTEVYEFKGQIN